VGRFSAPVLAALVGLVALTVAVGVAGAQRGTHLTGTNLIRPFVFAVEVPAGGTACQRPARRRAESLRRAGARAMS
jgi:hypothetical protein